MRTMYVPGHPAPQGSKRHVGNGRMIESSKRCGPWRDTIALYARQSGGILPVGPVAVELAFVMPRPKQTPKRTPPAVKRPDIDKLTRAVLDAITGIWIADDSHVTSLHATKRLADPGEQPGCGVTVRPIKPACFVCGSRADRPDGCGPECLTGEAP